MCKPGRASENEGRTGDELEIADPKHADDSDDDKSVNSFHTAESHDQLRETAPSVLPKPSCDNLDSTAYKADVMRGFALRDPAAAFAAWATQRLRERSIELHKRQPDAGKTKEKQMELTFNMKVSFRYMILAYLAYYDNFEQYNEEETVKVTWEDVEEPGAYCFNYFISTPWYITKFWRDCKQLILIEQGQIRQEGDTPKLRYESTQKTIVSAGAIFDVSCICELHGVGDGGCVLRCVYQCECPKWVPGFVVSSMFDSMKKGKQKTMAKFESMAHEVQRGDIKLSPRMQQWMAKAGLELTDQ